LVLAGPHKHRLQWQRGAITFAPEISGDVFPQGSLGSCRSLWFFVWLNAGLMVSWWCGLINVDVS
jgi:hypothetical protein